MIATPKTIVAAVLLVWASCGAMADNTQNGYYEVTDSFGKYRLKEPPQRIVVTDWTLLENILELGVEPVGAPELDLYRRYVKQPALPQGIVDIGLRQSPNLQSLRQLAPDVTILGTDQKPLSRPILHFSNVMFYNSFSDKYRTNGKKSRVRFLQIADLLQKRELAEQKLAAMDAELADIKAQIDRHFNDNPPKVTLVRFRGLDRCLVYGANSIPHHTLLKLGLETGMPLARTKWGATEMAISRLADIDDGIIIYTEPLEQPEALFNSDTWQAIPAAQQNRVRSMAPVWSYGGAMSVLYNARAIRDALIPSPQPAH